MDAAVREAPLKGIAMTGLRPKRAADRIALDDRLAIAVMLWMIWLQRPSCARKAETSDGGDLFGWQMSRKVVKSAIGSDSALSGALNALPLASSDLPAYYSYTLWAAVCFVSVWKDQRKWCRKVESLIPTSFCRVHELQFFFKLF
jgi:hypothetical protein